MRRESEDRPKKHRRANMVIPRLTHLQYFALAKIAAGVVRGRDLREALSGEDVAQKPPTFYLFMGRLEDAGLLTGEYATAAGGARGKERVYSLTPEGRKALKDVAAFYRRLEKQAGGK